MIVNLLKPVLSAYIKASILVAELYNQTLVEIMTDKAKTERDKLVADREAKYQADKAEREKVKESSSQVQ